MKLTSGSVFIFDHNNSELKIIVKKSHSKKIVNVFGTTGLILFYEKPEVDFSFCRKRFY